MSIERMKYSRYKEHYSDCKAIFGSYDKGTKTVEVEIPDGRKKPSGVRGERFHTYQLWLTKATGERGYCMYRAVSRNNAIKQHIKWCAVNGWKPDEEVAALY